MNFVRLILVCAITLSLAGCGPSFPKANLAGEIVSLCKKEYNIDIKTEVIGRTLAVYVPMPTLFDITFAIDEKAQEMIQNVLLAASRVSLSTDADLLFYCVIAQDVRLPEIQVIIIKYIDDVKRAFYTDISRDEYFKRTIFDININPQSKKEQTIKEIFKKYDLDPQWEEQVLDEFFRTSPLDLKDFGYWQNRFYVKDITKPEFFAEQIAYRVKMRMREDKKLSEKFITKKVDGSYEKTGAGADFYIKFDIPTSDLLSAVGQVSDIREVFRIIVDEAADCLYGYKFEDFNTVKIFDVNSNAHLLLTKENIYLYQRNRLKMDAILKGIQGIGGA